MVYKLKTTIVAQLSVENVKHSCSWLEFFNETFSFLTHHFFTIISVYAIQKLACLLFLFPHSSMGRQCNTTACIFAFWTGCQFPTRRRFKKNVPRFSSQPDLKWVPEMSWEVKVSSMILTTSPVEYRLVYKNVGPALYILILFITNYPEGGFGWPRG